MTSMKDLGSATGEERDDVIRRQAAELERLQAEVAAWRKRYEKGDKRDIAFTNSESEVEPLYTALDVLQGEADAVAPAWLGGALVEPRGGDELVPIPAPSPG